MSKVIDQHLRYRVERNYSTGWKAIYSSAFLWVARRRARDESKYYTVRVIDSKGDS